MLARHPFAVLVSIFIAVQSPLVSAQDPSSNRAQSLFQRGRESMKKGQLEDALRYLIESQTLDPKPGTLLNIALCEEKLGRLVRARSRLHEFDDSAQADDDRRPLALRHLADINQKLPHVTIRLERQGAQEVVVRLDGANVEKADLGVPLPLDPGEHVLVVTRTDGQERTSNFQIAERQELLQVLDWADAPEAPRASAPRLTPSTPGAVADARSSSTDPPQNHEGPRRLAGMILGGLGVAAAAATALSTFEVLSNKRTIEEHCDVRGCDADALEATSAGRTWSTVGTVSGIVAVASMGAGAYFLFVHPSPPNRTTLPRSIRAMGVEVGPSGPTLTVAGSF